LSKTKGINQLFLTKYKSINFLGNVN